MIQIKYASVFHVDIFFFKSHLSYKSLIPWYHKCQFYPIHITILLVKVKYSISFYCRSHVIKFFFIFHPKKPRYEIFFRLIFPLYLNMYRGLGDECKVKLLLLDGVIKRYQRTNIEHLNSFIRMLKGL